MFVPGFIEYRGSMDSGSAFLAVYLGTDVKSSDHVSQPQHFSLFFEVLCTSYVDGQE